jgi:dTMP kinase
LTGLLITMEGVDGCGKSTQIQRLAARLRLAGVPVAVSKEPGGTPLCQELRSLLLERHASGETWAPRAELLLFYADRAQHVARFIAPMLAQGKVVLLDRFDDSTRAYQGVQGIDDGTLDWLRADVLGGLAPALTLVLDLDPAQSLARTGVRNAAAGDFRETRFDQETLDFHRRVRERFLDLARREPARMVVIPAQGPVAAVEAAVWAQVEPRLRKAGYPAAGA